MLSNRIPHFADPNYAIGTIVVRFVTILIVAVLTGLGEFGHFADEHAATRRFDFLEKDFRKVPGMSIVAAVGAGFSRGGEGGVRAGRVLRASLRACQQRPGLGDLARGTRKAFPHALA